MDSQAEIFYSGLIDTCLLDSVGRTELVSGIRNLARIEEYKKHYCAENGRRGNRFTHYFAQNEVHIGQASLDDLCNTLFESS